MTGRRPHSGRRQAGSPRRAALVLFLVGLLLLLLLLLPVVCQAEEAQHDWDANFVKDVGVHVEKEPPPPRMCNPEHEGRRLRKFRHIELELERRKLQLRGHLEGTKPMSTNEEVRKVMEKIKGFRKRREEVFHAEHAEAQLKSMQFAQKRLARSGWQGEQYDQWGIAEVKKKMDTYVPVVKVNVTEEIRRRRSSVIDSDRWREERKETRWR